MANGFILWEGLSLLNKQPIVVIATGFKDASKNKKTGSMIQVYILLKDKAPYEALKTKEDEAICGNCPLRNGACYVQIMHGPQSVWRAYKAGKYPKITSSSKIFKDLAVRFGTYGDPAAVPFKVWNNVIKQKPSFWTGYTHQWRTSDKRYKTIFMASVDNPEEAREAIENGWRCFLTRMPDGTESLEEGFISCPASKEAGKKTQCIDCGLCDGKRGSTDNRKNISIMAHNPTKLKSYMAMRKERVSLMVLQ